MIRPVHARLAQSKKDKDSTCTNMKNCITPTANNILNKGWYGSEKGHNVEE